MGSRSSVWEGGSVQECCVAVVVGVGYSKSQRKRRACSSQSCSRCLLHTFSLALRAKANVREVGGFEGRTSCVPSEQRHHKFHRMVDNKPKTATGKTHHLGPLVNAPPYCPGGRSGPAPIPIAHSRIFSNGGQQVGYWRCGSHRMEPRGGIESNWHLRTSGVVISRGHRGKRAAWQALRGEPFTLKLTKSDPMLPGTSRIMPRSVSGPCSRGHQTGLYTTQV